MDSKTYTVFIIDDHPLISEAYKSALKNYSKEHKEFQFSVKVAMDCDKAFDLITEFSNHNKTVDFVFLDISLPPSKNRNILSGEDLGLKINALFPNTKIIISTTYNDNYRVHSIFRSLNPEGFLIKNDITPKEILSTIDSIIKNSPYYSKTVIKLLRKNVVNDFLLDNLDRKLLYEISIGTKMSELPNIIPLSKAAIEKRKRNLKVIFNLKGDKDRELIAIAKEKGFI